MNLKTLLEKKNMSMYRLSQLSGVPRTTVIDICSGKSSIEGCNAITVYRLSQALGCKMEDLMKTATAKYDRRTGLPKDKSYLEKGLPPYLEKSLNAMKRCWKIEDSGKPDIHWDVHWCELYADINSAENEQSISKKQADYLRCKYLKTEKNND